MNNINNLKHLPLNRNTISYKALLIFGTTFWLALVAFWLALITWQSVALITAVCVLAMIAVGYLPGPEELYRRRHKLRAELQHNLVFLHQQLKEAKEEFDHCRSILGRPDLPAEMQVRYRLAYRFGLLSVISKESQIAQTNQNLERLLVKINESYAELEELILARERFQLAQQALRVACA